MQKSWRKSGDKIGKWITITLFVLSGVLLTLGVLIIVASHVSALASTLVLIGMVCLGMGFFKAALIDIDEDNYSL